jgi:hypothetical protein
VVRFRPRPKRPAPAPPPRPQPRAYRPNTGGHEPAINWSRAPKAIVLLVLFFIAMALIGGLGDWIGRIGAS